MHYTPLSLPPSLSPAVTEFIRSFVERYLFEIHVLLATVFETGSPKNQLQQSIALTILSTIGGVSKVLYSTTNEHGEAETYDGPLFQGFVKDFFPVEADAPSGCDIATAAAILYKAFRCPMVHSLSADTHRELTKLKTVSARFTKVGRVFRGTENASERVADLETSSQRPMSKPWLVVRDDAVVLWLDGLYWNLRRAIETWAQDPNQTAGAEARVLARLARLDEEPRSPS